MVDVIGAFEGEYRFLSNFALSTISAHVLKQDIHASTVEHAFQAMKAVSADDRICILSCRTPGEAKRMGKAIKRREDWDEIRVKVMRALVLAKFQQNPKLAEKLLATGDAKLVEGNWWGDTFWGVCRGKGENHLGRILMWVRAELRRHQPEPVVGAVADEREDEVEPAGKYDASEVTTPLSGDSAEDLPRFTGPWAKLDQYLKETEFFSFPWQWIQHPLFREVCFLPDITEEVIHRMEMGERNWPYFTILARMCNFDPTNPKRVEGFTVVNIEEAAQTWISWYRNRQKPGYWSELSGVAPDEETGQEGGQPEGASGATE
jgi:ribA/ribD-fused uncharacterized protein